MVGIGFFELVFVALFGGFLTGVPLGMPPGPEDPALARVAPEECLAYVSWCGVAEASSKSANQTEQLLAEPEVRRFVDEIQARLKGALKQGAGEGERGKVVSAELPKLVEAVATRPTALFLEQINVLAARPDVRGGMIVNVGDRAAELQKALLAIEKAVEAESTVSKADKIEWHVMPGPAAAGLVMQWGFVDGYFVLGIGEGSAVKLVERMRDGKPPEWLTSLKKRLAVPRLASVTHIDVERIIGMVSGTLRGLPGQQGAILEKLGLDKLRALDAVTGLDESGCVSRSLVRMDGRPAMLLKLLDSAALKPNDLAPIPEDAAIALAFRFDAVRTLKAFTALAEQIENGAAAKIEKDFDKSAEDLGFSLREDLLPALGDTWRIYQSPGEGGTLFTNWTGVVSVRDPKKLAEIATVIEFRAREARRKARELTPRPRFLAIDPVKFEGQTIHFLNFVGEESPVAPAWCFTGNELIVSTFPQGVQAYLARGEKGKSLADVPSVADRLQEPAAPMGLAYYDSANICRAVYPLVQMFGNQMTSELQQAGVDVNIALLPSLPTLLRHMRPATTSIVAAEDGLETTSRHTLPISLGPGEALASMTFVRRSSAQAFSFGGASSSGRSFSSGSRRSSVLDALSPEKSQRTASTNNLKQLALAMHNFHDTQKSFPAAATKGKDGKPLLSWRVQLLPFLEEAALFNQFHHDEPWDSPHNKALIPRMPKLFQSPGSKAGEGKTVYLTVRGPGTAFPPDKARGIRDITDGTSNTVMIVEVSDQEAVTWTKPDDFVFNEKEPIKGLVGLRKGGFLAALCDGSVRFIAETINADTLRNLFLVSDGNVIGDF